MSVSKFSTLLVDLLTLCFNTYSWLIWVSIFVIQTFGVLFLFNGLPSLVLSLKLLLDSLHSLAQVLHQIDCPHRGSTVSIICIQELLVATDCAILLTVLLRCLYWHLSVTSHTNCITARCLINVVYLTACCLYQVMMTLHFLNDVANDAESTQNRKLRHNR